MLKQFNRFIKSIMGTTKAQQQDIDNKIIISGLTEKYAQRRQLWIDKRTEIMLARRAYEARKSLESLRKDQIEQSHQDRQHAMTERVTFVRTVAPAMIAVAKARYEFEQHFRSVLPIYREAAGVCVTYVTPSNATILTSSTFDECYDRR